MSYLQKLGRSLMLPMAVLPVAGMLFGIGYWIGNDGTERSSIVAAILLKLGGILIYSMAILFATGISAGMAKANEDAAVMAGIISWLIISAFLGAGTDVDFAPGLAENLQGSYNGIYPQFTGILAGAVGAACCNRFQNTKVPPQLMFFSGKKLVSLMAAATSAIIGSLLFFAWPVVMEQADSVESVLAFRGAGGTGIYAFLSKVAGPFGLFDEKRIVMSGYYPVSMFGLPAAALAMFHTARTGKKKSAAGVLGACALCSFFTGITEPMEYVFMLLAPGLYLVHAALTGAASALLYLLPVRAEFGLGAGLLDFLMSMESPQAQNPLLLIPAGMAAGAVYYSVFRKLIVKFDLKTPGREN